MSDPERIDPRKAREHIERGDALLICAYDDDEKCRDVALEGSEPYSRLEAKEDDLADDREIIFYCT